MTGLARRNPVDALSAAVSGRVTSRELEPLRAEAAAIDVDAALSLAREVLGAAEPPSPSA